MLTISPILALLALGLVLPLQGCSTDPVRPGARSGSESDVRISVSIIPPVSPRSVPELDQARTLEVLIFDVTGDPTQPPPPLERAVRHAIVIPDGAYFVDQSFQLNPAAAGSDYRVTINFADGERSFAGTRTVLGLRAGNQAFVEFFLTPPGLPEQDFNGIQVGDSAALPGATGHLIPIVLANGAPVGGFQFDLSVDPAVVGSIQGFDIDPASRLRAVGDLTARFNRLSSSPTRDVWRILVASTTPETAPISEGQDVLFFLQVLVGNDATSDDILLSGGVISAPDGTSMRPVEGNGRLTIVGRP